MAGIHHVTAISGPARRNLDFYSGTLGLRLVKKTVNFDDPQTYHLYYGDEAGRPGTILTFFPWQNVAAGRLGAGETAETAFRIPQASIGYWMQRLIEKGAAAEPPARRFSETALAFRDPDGTRLALVGVPGIEAEPAWGGSAVPAEHAIRGLHGVTLLVWDTGPTGKILDEVLGFSKVASEDGVVRHAAAGVNSGSVVDLRPAAGLPRGRLGGGTVHHVAFRAADEAEQLAMVARLAEAHGLDTTEVKDRNYFRSVYFREPGHVLFEIATDAPGFAVDEAAETLGQALKLPRFLEPERARIEAVLPELG